MIITLIVYVLILLFIITKGFYSYTKYNKNLKLTTSIEFEAIPFILSKSKIDLFIFLIIFLIAIFLNINIFFENIAYCQESYIHNLSDEDFNTWLENANKKADYLNLDSLHKRTPLLYSIEEDINKLIIRPSSNFNLLEISNNITNNWNSLILKNIEYKNFFLQIPMTFQNQEMPIEMYMDSLEFLVDNFNKDLLSINYCKELFETNDINTAENLLKFNRFKNTTLNNITELQQHTSLIDFNSLYDFED